MSRISFSARLRVKQEKANSFKVTAQTVNWDLEKVAVIICDMWNTHHCTSSADRTAEMAPHMNEVLTRLRNEGTLIIHAPSGCMEFYEESPQRKRSLCAPQVDAPVDFDWNSLNPDCEAPLPDGIGSPGPCACLTSMPCCEEGYYPWDRQIEEIRIDVADAVSDSGQEVYNLFKQRGIEAVCIMGVHTNVCVLGRPFGIRQLIYLGIETLLCRDLTDSHHSHGKRHFEGTELIIEHIEKYWCPTVTSNQLVGGRAFQFRDDKRPPPGATFS